jgi:hypothetical protein
MEVLSNSVDLKNLNLSLFLNIVGGKHLMLNIGEGKIIKITSEEEVNFYNKYSNLEYSFLPKCFGFFDRKENPELNKLILDYKQQLDFIIYDIVRDYDENQIRSFMFHSDFSIFLEKFHGFLKKCEENIHLKKECESLTLLKEKFSKFSQEKLRFFLDNFIYKLVTIPDKSKFVVIEDLTYGMQRPCVVDFKLGFVNAKLNQNYRDWVSNSICDLGLRLMGAQVIKNFI